MHDKTSEQFFKDEIIRVLESDRYIDFHERFDTLKDMFAKRMQEEIESSVDEELAYDRGYEDGFHDGETTAEEHMACKLQQSYDDGYADAKKEVTGFVEARYNNEFGAKLIREFDRGVAHGKMQMKNELMEQTKSSTVPQKSSEK